MQQVGSLTGLQGEVQTFALKLEAAKQVVTTAKEEETRL
jgi:hypothetical protein